jgi:adenylate kinase
MNDDTHEIEQNLNKAQTELNEHYYNFGKQMLEMADREDKEISTLVDEIIKLKNQLNEQRQTRQCPKCLEVNNNENRYCSHCGNKL